MAPHGGGTRFGLRSMTEGLRYLKGRQALQGTFVADLDAMVFGMPRALFPAIGLVRLHGGPGHRRPPLRGSGSGRARRRDPHRLGEPGLAPGTSRCSCAVAVWGAAITAFGFAPWLVASPAPSGDRRRGGRDLCGVQGDDAPATGARTALRGRLNAVHTAVVTGGPRLGDAEAGAVAALGGVQVSVVSGGLACLVGIGLVGWLMPRFAAYRDDPLARGPGSDRSSEAQSPLRREPPSRAGACARRTAGCGRDSRVSPEATTGPRGPGSDPVEEVRSAVQAHEPADRARDRGPRGHPRRARQAREAIRRGRGSGPRDGIGGGRRSAAGRSCTSTSASAAGCRPAVTSSPGSCPTTRRCASPKRRPACDSPIRQAGPRLLHVDVHPAADGHTHLDLRYLLIGPDAEPSPPPGESPHARWFSWSEALERSDVALVGALRAAQRQPEVARPTDEQRRALRRRG